MRSLIIGDQAAIGVGTFLPAARPLLLLIERHASRTSSAHARSAMPAARTLTGSPAAHRRESPEPTSVCQDEARGEEFSLCPRFTLLRILAAAQVHFCGYELRSSFHSVPVFTPRRRRWSTRSRNN